MAYQQRLEIVMSDRSSSSRTWWKGVFRLQETGLFLGVAAVLGVIYLSSARDSFYSPYSLQDMLHQIALFGVLSLGAAIVIIAGGIDLSVGSVVALSSVVAARLMRDWLPALWPGGSPPQPALVGVTLVITLSAGFLIGVFHAFLINQIRLPPFIATLATLAGLRSVARLISLSQPIGITSALFVKLGNDTTVTVTIFTVLAIILSVIMGTTVLGRHLYALGGNEAAARLSGLRVPRLKVIAYGLSGLAAALGGILFAGSTGQGDGNLGIGYELWAITAAVVGGCSLSGGAGSIRGTVLGLVLVQIVIKGTGQFKWGVSSTEVEGLVLGTVVVLAVAFNQRNNKSN